MQKHVWEIIINFFTKIAHVAAFGIKIDGLVIFFETGANFS